MLWLDVSDQFNRESPVRCAQPQLQQSTDLKQSEEFEDNHDNDDYSDYVEDVSVHARDLYQSECVVASLSRMLGVTRTVVLICDRFLQRLR